MNCLIWILLLCCCGSNGGNSCGNNSCSCGCNNGCNSCGDRPSHRHQHHHHEDDCSCKEERVDKDCFQVKRDTCEIPPFPAFSRGETCGCEADE